MMMMMVMMMMELLMMMMNENVSVYVYVCCITFAAQKSHARGGLSSWASAQASASA